MLRGHTDEIHGVATSDSAQLVASAGKNGDIMLWKMEGGKATDGYLRLPENLAEDQVLRLDRSRLLLLPSGRSPELVDLSQDIAPAPLSEIKSADHVLGWFGTNILCHWDGTSRILVREWRGSEFHELGAVTLDSGTNPTRSRFAYDPNHRLLAWAERPSSASVYLTSLKAPSRRIELKSDVADLVSLRFNQDGSHLMARAEGGNSLRAWNVESGQPVVAIGKIVGDAHFASGGRVLVAVIEQGNNHEVQFHNLAHPGQEPQRVPGKDFSWKLAVSPDGGLVASSTWMGQVRLFDPATGGPLASLHAHLMSAFGIGFSPDRRRLISASGARESVKLWDVGTRQELLTLAGGGSGLFQAQWSADGDLILSGPPWQAWRAPSWEEINAAEASEAPSATAPRELLPNVHRTPSTSPTSDK